MVDDATAAKTVQELESEIVILKDLEEQAKQVVASGLDRKWEELSKILQNNPEMRDAGGRQRKLIIFSEHRDTLNYLHARIAGVLGNHDAIVTIHGGTHRDERRRLQALFRSDPEVRVLVATDAAGEGVNLQNANLMVNYDLPWNPNRLEQRFGRIHRIGQTEVCHLWNLVAKETREGDVYHRLLKKIEIESEALKGRVFDILGEVFEETSLKDLLIQAIRYGDQPEIRARLTKKIDHALDHNRLKSLLDRNALAQETMNAERLYSVKEEMDRAEARRLQPYFVRSFFLKAFEQLGGSLYPREASRFEITHVPASIRERDRRISGRNRREQEPVLKRYERIWPPASAVDGTKAGRGATFRCLLSGSPMDATFIRGEFVAKRTQSRLMAAVVEGPNGRLYISPTADMEAVAHSESPAWRPDAEMNQDSKDLLSGRGYGFRYWHELFTTRQLVALTTLSELVAKARDRVLADASKAGLADDRRGIASGGTGFVAYADAVAVYLGLCVDKASLTNTTQATWQKNPDRLTQAFGRQAIPMVWDYAEANPLSDAGGGFGITAHAIAKVLERLPEAAVAGVVSQEDATRSCGSIENFIYSTDPPYYDNISYADLSDYFYVWLRPTLRMIYPKLFDTHAVPKLEELVATRIGMAGGGRLNSFSWTV